jgi:hypothetical protein
VEGRKLFGDVVGPGRYFHRDISNTQNAKQGQKSHTVQKKHDFLKYAPKEFAIA